MRWIVRCWRRSQNGTAGKARPGRTPAAPSRPQLEALEAREVFSASPGPPLLLPLRGGSGLLQARLKPDDAPTLQVSRDGGATYADLVAVSQWQAVQGQDASAEGALSLAVGDFDQDGQADYALHGGDSVCVLLGQGDNTYEAYGTLPASAGASSELALADANGDGQIELTSVYASPPPSSPVSAPAQGDPTGQPWAGAALAGGEVAVAEPLIAGPGSPFVGNDALSAEEVGAMAGPFPSALGANRPDTTSPARLQPFAHAAEDGQTAVTMAVGGIGEAASPEALAAGPVITPEPPANHASVLEASAAALPDDLAGLAASRSAGVGAFREGASPLGYLAAEWTGELLDPGLTVPRLAGLSLEEDAGTNEDGRMADLGAWGAEEGANPSAGSTLDPLALGTAACWLAHASYLGGLRLFGAEAPAAPDAAGGTMNHGGGTVLVADVVQRSAESFTRLVREFYERFLGRSADPGEDQGWVNLLLRGGTEEQVLSSLLGGDEFYQRATTADGAGTAPERFLGALYQCLLGRAPSEVELGNWLGALPSLGRAGVVSILLGSLEYRALVVEAIHREHRRRPEAAELAAWAATPFDLLTIRRHLAARLAALLPR